jgi:Leucine-rich repeat (LRR) protein
MTISNATFVQGIYQYLRDYPEAIDAQTQYTLTALAKNTFENEEKAIHALADFVERVQRSDKPGLKKIVQALFDQEMKRLSSAPAAEEPLEKRPRPETGNTGIGILDLPQDPLAHIFSFLDLKDQRQAAQVCRDFRGAMRLQRIYLLPLDTPEFRALSSLFGISLPPPNPSSCEVRAACESLFANVPYILEGVKASDVLSAEEQKPFLTVSVGEIVQDPSRLKNLLHTAHEISLVAPFLDGRNAGPAFLTSMTLEAKAETVRTHLKEKGDSYTELECGYPGMLCFPRELCSLQNLQILSLDFNRLISIPPEIGRLAQLRELDLFNNRLTTLPAEIGQLAQLRKLDLDNNRLISIPPEIGRLAQLRELCLDNNRLTTIPPEIGGIMQLRRLRLDNNRLTTMPAEIGQLEQLQSLFLRNNRLTTMPDEIWRLTKLVRLDLTFNRLTTVPAQIGQLAQLQYLYLSGNRLTTIPAEIWRCTQDIAISLQGNPLTVIPKSIENIHIIVAF